MSLGPIADPPRHVLCAPIGLEVVMAEAGLAAMASDH
jgi:hypothetical protein